MSDRTHPDRPPSPPSTPPPGEPSSLELGAAGAPIGVGTAADFEAELEAAEAALAAARARRFGARPWRGRTALGRRTRHPADWRPEPPLLADERFRVFWLSRLATQIAQGAMLYALLIIIVDRTDASFFNSLFVICSIVPSVAFGLPAGIVVDTLPRRPLMVALNLARFVFALSLVARDPGLPGLFAATLGLWTIHQFYSPSESATLATLVPRERYPAAQALSNLALTISQLVGLVILAPLLLKTAGPPTLFAVCGSLFVIGAGFAFLLPRLDEHLATLERRWRSRSIREGLLNGWRSVRADHTTYEALADDVLVGVGLSSLVVIMPLYLKGVLGTAAENTVFVFAPAALGLVFGLRFAPRIGRAVGERRTAMAGLLGFAVCVAALGFVTQMRGFLNDTIRIPIDPLADFVGIPPLVVLTMLISVPAGFASALVSVSARAVLLARTPPTLRGQVLATASLMGNIGALVPTLLAGIAADIFGVERIAVAIAVLIAGGALAAHAVTRRPVPVPSTP